MNSSINSLKKGQKVGNQGAVKKRIDIASFVKNPMAKNIVYVIYFSDESLYVGLTRNSLAKRITAHHFRGTVAEHLQKNNLAIDLVASLGPIDGKNELKESEKLLIQHFSKSDMKLINIQHNLKKRR